MQAYNSNTKLFVKVVENKRLGTLRVVAAFNVTQRSEKTGKLLFPTHKHCAFISGDLATQADVFNAIKAASVSARTNNIEVEL